MRVVYVPGTFNLCIINYGTCNWKIIIGDIFTAHTFRNTSHREEPRSPSARGAQHQVDEGLQPGQPRNKKLDSDLTTSPGGTNANIIPLNLYIVLFISTIVQLHQIFATVYAVYAISKICQTVLRIDAVHSARCQNDLASTLDHTRICGGGFPRVTGAGKHSRRASDLLASTMVCLYIYINQIYTVYIICVYVYVYIMCNIYTCVCMYVRMHACRQACM